MDRPVHLHLHLHLLMRLPRWPRVGMGPPVVVSAAGAAGAGCELGPRTHLGAGWLTLPRTT